MDFLRPSLFVTLAASLVACGGDDSTATPTADSGPGPTVDAAPPLPPGCDYAELKDAMNDAASAEAIEATGLTYTTTTALCGKINTGHYDPTEQTVDFDAFSFDVAADSFVTVTLTGAGLEALTPAGFAIVNASGNAVASGEFLGNHGVAAGQLAVGSYFMVVYAQSGAAITADLDYKLVIAADSATRCAKATAAADFTEGPDTPSNTGNDMIEVRYNPMMGTPPVRLTANTIDFPEMTNLTLAAGTTYRIAGSSGATNASDDYIDRDTFAIATGPTTNRLTVRLNWSGTTSDLDYYLFNENMITSVGSSTRENNGEDELATFAVAPNTTYWLWIAAYDGSTGHPIAYDATVCPEAFTP